MTGLRDRPRPCLAAALPLAAALALLAGLVPSVAAYTGDGAEVFVDRSGDVFNSGPPAADIVRFAHGADSLVVEGGAVTGRRITVYLGTEAEPQVPPALTVPVVYDVALRIASSPPLCFTTAVRAMPDGTFADTTLYSSGSDTCSGATPTTWPVEAAWRCNQLRLTFRVTGTTELFAEGTTVHLGRAGAAQILATKSSSGLIYDAAEVASASFELGTGHETGARPPVRDMSAARTGLTNVTLAWTAPVDDGGSPLLGYTVLRGAQTLAILPASTTTWLDDGALEGQTHDYQVKARYCDTESTPQQRSVTMPAPLAVALGGPYLAQTFHPLTLVAAPTGGEPAYAMAWRIANTTAGSKPTLEPGPGGTATFNTDLAGTYTVRVIVADGDPFSADVETTAQIDVQAAAPPPDPPLVPTIHAQSLRWFEHSRISVGSTVQGGRAPYLCSWRVGVDNATVLSGDCSGAVLAYDEQGTSGVSLVVVDSKGVQATATVEVTIAASPAGDGDADGRRDSQDNCIATPNADQADADVDGRGDACDPFLTTPTAPPPPPGPLDSDHDGIADATDNCDLVANAQQADGDRDGIGDACEAATAPASTSTICRGCDKSTSPPGTPWAIVGVGGAVVMVGAIVILFLTMAGGTRKPPPRF